MWDHIEIWINSQLPFRRQALGILFPRGWRARPQRWTERPSSSEGLIYVERAVGLPNHHVYTCPASNFTFIFYVYTNVFFLIVSYARPQESTWARMTRCARGVLSLGFRVALSGPARTAGVLLRRQRQGAAVVCLRAWEKWRHMGHLRLGLNLDVVRRKKGNVHPSKSKRSQIKE